MKTILKMLGGLLAGIAFGVLIGIGGAVVFNGVGISEAFTKCSVAERCACWFLSFGQRCGPS